MFCQCCKIFLIFSGLPIFSITLQWKKSVSFSFRKINPENNSEIVKTLDPVEVAKSKQIGVIAKAEDFPKLEKETGKTLAAITKSLEKIVYNLKEMETWWDHVFHLF